MMSISHSDLTPIRAERSDARLSQCETVIDIRQGFSRFLGFEPAKLHSFRGPLFLGADGRSP